MQWRGYYKTIDKWHLNNNIAYIIGKILMEIFITLAVETV